MTTTDLTELDRMLATHVMGWTEESRISKHWPVCFYDSECLLVMRQKDWHPTTDIAQAFMVLEKTGEDYIIRKIGDEYYVAIGQQAISDATPDKKVETAGSLAARAWLESREK